MAFWWQVVVASYRRNQARSAQWKAETEQPYGWKDRQVEIEQLQAKRDALLITAGIGKLDYDAQRADPDIDNLNFDIYRLINVQRFDPGYLAHLEALDAPRKAAYAKRVAEYNAMSLPEKVASKRAYLAEQEAETDWLRDPDCIARVQAEIVKLEAEIAAQGRTD
jgi:hypothetical protein